MCSLNLPNWSCSEMSQDSSLESSGAFCCKDRVCRHCLSGLLTRCYGYAFGGARSGLSRMQPVAISALINIARAQVQAPDCRHSYCLGGPDAVLAMVNFPDTSQAQFGSWHLPETIPKRQFGCCYPVLERRRAWAWPDLASWPPAPG